MHIRRTVALLLAAAAAAQALAAYGGARLRELIDEALEHHPSVRQAFAEYQAALHRVPQARALPDLQVSATQHVRPIETRVGAQPRMLAVSQRIPGFGKRLSRGQLAAKQAAVSEAIYQARRAEVAHGVKQAYFELGYLDRALAVSRDDEQALSHFEELARGRYSQGFGLQGEVVRLHAELTQALQLREGLELQRSDAAEALNQLRGSPPGSAVAPVRSPGLPTLKLDGPALSAVGRGASPELKAAFLRIETREKALHLARQSFRPDFTVGVGWGNIRARSVADASAVPPGNGKDVYSVTVGVTLPLFRAKYDAGVREAAERTTAARAAYLAAVRVMEAAVRTLSFRLGSIRRQIDLYRSTLAPQAEQALAAMEAAYASGELEVVGLLDAHRMLLDVRLGLARQEADYLQALAELERVVGASLAETESSAGGGPP